MRANGERVCVWPKERALLTIISHFTVTVAAVAFVFVPVFVIGQYEFTIFEPAMRANRQICKSLLFLSASSSSPSSPY